jgi:hypothetical protein
MAVRNTQGMPRIEVRTDITKDLHERLIAECGHCGCHIRGFVAIAIAKEIAARKKKRIEEAQEGILEGQIELGAASGADTVFTGVK